MSDVTSESGCGVVGAAPLKRARADVADSSVAGSATESAAAACGGGDLPSGTGDAGGAGGAASGSATESAAAPCGGGDLPSGNGDAGGAGGASDMPGDNGLGNGGGGRGGRRAVRAGRGNGGGGGGGGADRRPPFPTYGKFVGNVGEKQICAACLMLISLSREVPVRMIWDQNLTLSFGCGQYNVMRSSQRCVSSVAIFGDYLQDFRIKVGHIFAAYFRDEDWAARTSQGYQRRVFLMKTGAKMAFEIWALNLRSDSISLRRASNEQARFLFSFMFCVHGVALCETS